MKRTFLIMWYNSNVIGFKALYIALLMYMLMTCSIKGAPSGLDKDRASLTGQNILGCYNSRLLVISKNLIYNGDLDTYTGH
jgi:hypothetical protein